MTKGREKWEAFARTLDAGTAGTGNAGRDAWERDRQMLKEPTVRQPAQTVTAPQAAGEKKKRERQVISPRGTFLGGFSFSKKEARQKSAKELADERAQQELSEKEYQRLLGLELDKYRAEVEQAGKRAQKEKAPYNIHAFGGYDANRKTEAERQYAAMKADLNKAESLQYDVKGREALDKLTAEQDAALEVLNTERKDTAKRQAAWQTMQQGGYSDEEISQLAGYHRNIPKREQNAEWYAYVQKLAQQRGESDPVGGTLLSTPANLLSGLGTVDAALRKLADPDTPTDYNAPAMLPYAYASGVRGEVTKNLQYDHGDGVAFLYGVGTSMLDSAATAALAALGVPPAAASATLGGAAATDAMVSAKERGLDDGHAIATGVAAGVFESFFEKYSLESLISMKLPTGTMKQRLAGMLKNTAIQAGIEGSEEMFTDMGNLLADKIINGGMSDVDQRINAYVAGGMSYQEAQQKVVGETIKDIAVDFGAGALAGGLMGGGNMAVQTAVQHSNELTAERYRQLLQEAGVQLDEQQSAGNTALDEAADKYGAQAEAFRSTYTEGQDVALYDSAYRIAYEYGKAGAKEEAVMRQDSLSYLSETQRKIAYIAGREAAAWQNGLGENGSKAWAEVQNTDVESKGKLQAGFTVLYQAGLRRESAANVKSAAASALPQSVQTAAYEAGLSDAAASLAREKAGLDFVSSAGSESGLVDNEYSQKMAKEQAGTAALLNTLGKNLGVRIEMVDTISGGKANGVYLSGRNLIQIAADADNAFGFVAAHEVTHRMQELAPEEYRAYRDHAMSYRARESGEEGAAAYVERYRAMAEEAGVKLTQEEAMDEIAADFTREMMENGKLFENFAKENRSAAKNLLDALKAFVAKVKSLFRSKTAQDRAAQDAYGKSMAELEQCAALWQKAYDAAGKQAQKTKTAAREGDGEGRYQIKQLANGMKYVKADRQVLFGSDPEAWSEQLESYINGKIRNHEDVRLIAEDGDILVLTSKSAGKLSSQYDNRGRTMSEEAFERKANAAAHIDELIKVSVRGGKTVLDVAGRHGDMASDGWNYRKAYFMDFDGSYYRVRISVALGKDGSIIYNIGEMQKRSIPQIDGSSGNSGALRGNTSDNSISTSSEKVNGKFSLKTNTEGGGAVQEVGVSVDGNTDSASPGRFSLKTWNESDYVQKRKEASEELSRALGVSVRTAKKYIDNINSVAKMIADDRVRLDYEASPGRSSFVGNSEYGGSLDFSTICKKRRLLTGTLEAIQSALPNTALTADEILSIRRMMADKGYEVSCGLCYVEGSRAKMGVYTKEFLAEYAKSGAEYVPNMAEMNTATGQERIRAEHPEVYEAYEKYMNKLAQRKPKLYQLATEYQGEIRKKFKGKGSVEEKNKNGGMRLQSFSDFEIIHLIDCMQAIMDMSEVGLAGQAYTKVPDFAWALGDTGLKINLSLIAKGVDTNGNIILDETEGMTRSDAEALRKRYPKNVGTILVAFNDAQLRAAMKNDFIDFIIPFHRSQWNSEQYAALGLPQGAKDYTPWQNESYIEPVYNKNGKKQRPANYMPNEYWDYGRSGKENAEKYLQMCAENNRKPKFSFLLDKGADGAYHLKSDGSTDGYWKLLIDFKMYDNGGNGSPQTPVSPKFNMEECERMLRDYTGGHAAFPVANDVVDQFVETYKESNPDIHYQLKSATELEREVKELKKERRALENRNRVLTERVAKWRGELRRTETPSVRPGDVKKLGQRFLSDYGSSTDYRAIEGDMTALGKALMADDVSMDTLRPHARAAAEKIIDGVLVQSESGGELLAIRDHLKNVTLRYTDDGSIPDFKDWRRANRRTLKISDKSGLYVDVAYSDLTEMFGEGYFPSTIIHPGDQLLRMSEVLDNVGRIYENPFDGYRDAAVTELSDLLIDGMIGEDVRQSNPTFADRQALELQETKARLTQMLIKTREGRDRQALELQETKARLTQMLIKTREGRDRQVERMRRHYQEQTKAGRERRNATALRAKIARHTADLSRKLLTPTDKQHIPEALRKSVAALLGSINQESAYSYGENGKLVHNADGDPTKRTQAAIALKNAYDEILKSGEALVIDPDLLDSEGAGLLDQVMALGNKRIADMNSEELTTVWQAVRAIEQSVSTFNKNLAIERYAGVQELAEALRSGTRRRANRKLALEFYDPYTFFSAFGEPGKQLFRTLRNAQDKQNVMLKTIQAAAEKFMDKEVYKNRLERHEFFVGEDGRRLVLTTEQIMNFCNTMGNGEQALRHVTQGGIRQPEIKRNGKQPAIKRGTEDIRLTADDVATITGALTETQRKVAEGFQKIASGYLAKQGNDASMTVYGYEKFTNDNYWPIKAAPEGTKQDTEKNPNVAREIKNVGIAKARNPNANNALEIEGIYDVFARHASDMIQYSTLLAPMEDMNRLFNYRYRNATGNLTGKTVKDVLTDVYGEGAGEYWENLMRDVQNGIKGPDGAMARLVNEVVGNAKAASVGFNFRVVIQQPTAYIRAAAILDPSTMAKGIVGGATEGNGWEKAKKYAPIASIKDTAGFDQSSRYSIAQNVYGGEGGVMEWLNDKSGWAAGKADAVTWGAIWNACEWTVVNEGGYEKGSDAFFSRVAQVFTEVIDQSQVVDGIMQRAPVMRKPDLLMKQATAFMGEPLKALNMFMRSYDAWRFEQDTPKRSAAMKKMTRTIGAVLVTDVVNALVQSIMDAFRDDDKDKGYRERYLEKLTGFTGDKEKDTFLNVLWGSNIWDNIDPMGRIPFAKDVKSIMQGFTVNRMDSDVVETLVSAAKMFLRSTQDEGKKTTLYAAKQLLTAGSNIFGVSVANVGRDVWAIARSIAQSSGNIRVMYEMERAIWRLAPDAGNNTRYYKLLYMAMEQDKEAYQYIYEDMKKRGYSDKQLQDGIKKIIKDSDMSDTDMREQLEEIGYSGEEAQEVVDKWAFKEKYGYDYSDKREAFAEGTITRRQLIDEMVSIGGKTREEAEMAATVYEWQNEGVDIESNQTYIVKAYAEYGKPNGIDREDFVSFCRQASQTHGDDLDGDGKTDSGSKKVKILALIDGMALSAAQKDVLYRQQGYAESGLRDAPWH